jgi:hypothetical protein
MLENTAEDYSDRLDQARNAKPQMPNAQPSHPGDLHMPKNGQVDNYSGENNNTDRLAVARERDEKSGSINDLKNPANTAKNIAESATPASLLKQIDIMSDMPYIAALGAALIKDLLDFVAAPTVVLSVLFSILCSIFIFMMLMLVDASGKRKVAKTFLKKIGFLLFGGILDSIPGIDFLPIESLTVAVIYYLTLVERKNAAKE